MHQTHAVAQTKVPLSLSSNAFISSQPSLTSSLTQEMALLLPFSSHTFLSKTHHFPPLNPKRTRSILSIYHKKQSQFFKNQLAKTHATAEISTGGGLSVEDDQSVVLGEEQVRDLVDYDWTEEWYPLYLTQNVPVDAPLGLTVFDKQVVLYIDGSGELRCYEDRCPHRYILTLIIQLVLYSIYFLISWWYAAFNNSIKLISSV